MNIPETREDINDQVFQLLEDLYCYGMKAVPRNFYTIEADLCTLEIDPTLCLMNFTDRPFNWRYLAGETAWYLLGDTSTRFISKFSSFWNTLLNPDQTINSNYGHLLFSPNLKDVKNQIQWAFDSLIKDKYSRQAVMFLNQPKYQFENNHDFVCTMYVKFWIRNDFLHMKVQMRSNDIFFGLTYDAPWFSMIQQSMLLNLKHKYPDLKLGTYYHCADNIHYYERHFKLVQQILNNEVSKSPKFILRQPIFIVSDDYFSFSNETENFLRKMTNLTDEEIKNAPEDVFWKQAFSCLLDFSAE